MGTVRAWLGDTLYAERGNTIDRLLGENELVEMPVEEYRNTPSYARLRLRAFERDGFRCVFCNAKATTLHHRTNERYGHERLEDVTSTCYDCHAVLTEHRNLAE